MAVDWDKIRKEHAELKKMLDNEYKHFNVSTQRLAEEWKKKLHKRGFSVKIMPDKVIQSGNKTFTIWEIWYGPYPV
jgi:hypothetical protein